MAEMASGNPGATQREVSEKHGIQSFGPDGQSFKKNLILTPGKWTKYDPFLLMAEDWFSAESGGFPYALLLIPLCFRR